MALLVLGGCGEGGVRLSALDVTRVGWDTLRVRSTFENAGLGGDVVPDSLSVLVSDDRGRTLYAGYARQPRRPVVVPVPDPVLGSEAPFLLDLCGYFAGRTAVCEQHVLHASPKRLHAEVDVEYPLGRKTDALMYRLRWRQERETAEGAWQAVPVPAVVPARLVLYVTGHPRDALQVDVENGEGTVDLSKAPGYDDFWMRLHDPLLRGDSVAVRIRVDGRLGPRPDSVTTLTRWVAPVSRAERAEEAYAYAYNALDALLGRLETARDGRARLEVRSWRYDPLQRVYHVRIWTGWRGGFLHSDTFTLEGTLTVDEATQQATLRATHLSPDMQRLWMERVPGESVRLGRLESTRYAPVDEDGVE